MNKTAGPDHPHHFWIVDVLQEIEEYAKTKNLPKIAASIFAARGAVTHALDGEIPGNRTIGPKGEQWFDIVVDELARYCHLHGLTETEEHLIAALDAWRDAQRTQVQGSTVIPFRLED